MSDVTDATDRVEEMLTRVRVTRSERDDIRTVIVAARRAEKAREVLVSGITVDTDRVLDNPAGRALWKASRADEALRILDGENDE